MTGNLGWRCAFAEGNESEMTSSPTNVSVTHWNNFCQNDPSNKQRG
jgi:hypothetical protein